MTVTISVDAMGGDNAPDIVIDGLALSAVRHPDVFFKIFGQKDKIEKLVQDKAVLKDRFEIIHADDVVAMDAKPAAILRRGRETSLWKAITAVSEGEADAIISAGNTGALMAMSKLRLRMIEGIDRPAIASLWPTMKSEAVMLDMGANVEANSEQLVEFAVMGAEYAKILFDKKTPSVGLLNVGSEQVKGHDVVKVADSLLNENKEKIWF